MTGSRWRKKIHVKRSKESVFRNGKGQSAGDIGVSWRKIVLTAEPMTLEFEFARVKPEPNTFDVDLAAVKTKDELAPQNIDNFTVDISKPKYKTKKRKFNLAKKKWKKTRLLKTLS